MYSSKSGGRGGAPAGAAAGPAPALPDPARGATEQAEPRNRSAASAKEELVRILGGKGV